MSDPIEPKNRVTEVIAGVTTFMAMSYIIFVNPTLMAQINIPAEATFIWTCLAAAAGTAVAGWRIKLPTAIACGMGLNTFEVEFAKHTGMNWQSLMATCFIVGLIVFLLSVSGTRRRMIGAIPPQILSAIYAGVGAVLASVALKETTHFATQAGNGGWTLFCVGILIIVAVRAIYAWATTQSGAVPSAVSKKSQWLELFNSSAFLISIALMWLVSAFIVTPAPLPAHGSTYFAWMVPGAFHAITFEDKSLSFGLAVLFILLLDLAGGPFDFLTHKALCPELDDAERETKIRDGFLLDSGANIVAPLLGLSPMVYYIENNAGWHAGGRTGLSAKTTATLFLFFAILGAVFLWKGMPIAQFIPAFSVMPTLFFVGLMVIAESFTTPASDAVDPDAPGRYLYFVPAAVTTVAASLFSLDIAIAMGILAFAIISLFPTRYLGLREPPDHSRLAIVYLGAALVLWLGVRSDIIRL